MKPYLSIVIAARNDRHCGNFVRRLRCCLLTLYALINKYQLPTEILLIEWNPPSTRRLLHSILPSPPARAPLRVRILQVPAHIHKQYRMHVQLGMYPMIAKNVGIRRAKGRYVLCTNADIIFSEPLFAFLSRRKLRPGYFYRCHRCNIKPLPTALLRNYRLQAVLAFCNKHAQKHSRKNRKHAHAGSSHPLWYRQLLSSPLFQWLGRPIDRTYHQYHSLDTHACGDFTLMHRNDWQQIKGYAEFDTHPLHIDSLALGAAAALDKQQITLPLSHCVYHISHAKKWRTQSPMDKIAFDLRVPKIGYATLQELMWHMIKHKTVYAFNAPTWGHAHEHFHEFLIRKSQIEKPKQLKRRKQMATV